MKIYRPSNGTEGVWFESQWCENCIKNPISPDAKQCNVLCKELCNIPTGKWVYKQQAPTCTAFKSRTEHNKRRKPKQDKNQLELF